jgi:hypothetical protein
MAKKLTEEEKIISDAAKLIMHTIRVVSVRLADRYERKLMTELMACMQAKLEANEEVDKFNNNYIVDQLDKLSK